MGASVTTPHEITPLQFADEEVKTMCYSVKGQVEQKTGKKYDTFEAKSFKTQDLDHGTSYFITVQVGANEHVDMYVIKELSGQLIVQGVQEFKEPQS
ncbi:cystatin-B-like [Boleophthalmus pectinirostris]|uniref:cystatin-B-like n=1 Tax=Boleophthalmus pectinirostris TaxID=150288 RepID=UPI00242FC908|nr:cystatin-B-like [Boleophthalmus pectinirostris]